MAKYRILLADSNNQFQTTVRDYLTAQEGIERVDTVNDGQSALDAMNNNRYDVLLCDLIMPGMDGFELLERLNSGLVKDVPAVIVISALRQEEMVRQACTLGAKYYMVKPIDPDTLYKRIMDMMESTYAQRSQVCAISPKPQTLDEKIASVFLMIYIIFSPCFVAYSKVYFVVIMIYDQIASIYYNLLPKCMFFKFIHTITIIGNISRFKTTPKAIFLRFYFYTTLTNSLFYPGTNS